MQLQAILTLSPEESFHRIFQSEFFVFISEASEEEEKKDAAQSEELKDEPHEEKQADQNENVSLHLAFESDNNTDGKWIAIKFDDQSQYDK